MPHGRMKHLQLLAGRIYNLLKKEAAYGPNTQPLRTSGQPRSLRGLSTVRSAKARALGIALIRRGRRKRNGRLIECLPSTPAV